jgi:Host cell surface-exposed lipoprotein
MGISMFARVLTTAAVIFTGGCNADANRSADEAVNATPTVESSVRDTAPTPTEAIVEDTLTGPQRNAVRSAEQYLSMTGFSRDGLIEQLSSDAGDGYARSDATIAVDSLGVDWNDNAARSAQEYLSMTGFSCSGLIEQLSSSAGSKYTRDQAAYGARQAGAC